MLQRMGAIKRRPSTTSETSRDVIAGSNATMQSSRAAAAAEAGRLPSDAACCYPTRRDVDPSSAESGRITVVNRSSRSSSSGSDDVKYSFGADDSWQRPRPINDQRRDASGAIRHYQRQQQQPALDWVMPRLQQDVDGLRFDGNVWQSSHPIAAVRIYIERKVVISTDVK